LNWLATPRRATALAYQANRGHEVGRGVEEPLHVRLLDVGSSRLGVLEALNADELVLIGKALGELDLRLR
jgi:hypothetical protein